MNTKICLTYSNWCYGAEKTHIVVSGNIWSWCHVAMLTSGLNLSKVVYGESQCEKIQLHGQLPFICLFRGLQLIQATFHIGGDRMPVLCSSKCGAKAILKRPKTGDALCKVCLFSVILQMFSVFTEPCQTGREACQLQSTWRPILFWWLDCIFMSQECFFWAFETEVHFTIVKAGLFQKVRMSDIIPTPVLLSS